MKKLMFGILAFFILTTTFYSQTITSKDVTHPMSFGQKKFKKAPRKVYIANFRVYYQIYAYQWEKTGAFGPDATAKIGIGLEGLAAEDLKSLTDLYYNEFTKDLKEKGFGLVSIKEAGATALYTDWELHEGGELYEKQLFGYYMSTPNDYKYYVKKINKKGKMKGGSGLGLGRYAKLSKQLDDAIVIDVEVVVPFMNFEGKHKNLIVTNTAKLKATPELRIAPNGIGAGMTKGWIPITTHISFVSGNPAGASPKSAYIVELKKDIAAQNNILPNDVINVKAKGIPPTHTSGSVFHTTTTYYVTKSVDHTIAVKPEEYILEVGGLLNAFKKISLDEFFKYAVGE